MLADQLLAPLAADLFVHLRDDRGIDVSRIKSELRAVVNGVAAIADTARE